LDDKRGEGPSQGGSSCHIQRHRPKGGRKLQGSSAVQPIARGESGDIGCSEDASLLLRKDKMSAEEILADLESKLYKHLWENLPEEEKKSLFKKYAQFKQDKTALSFMIKGELRKKFGLGVFSLFVEER
jgi:hypothetical protein